MFLRFTGHISAACGSSSRVANVSVRIPKSKAKIDFI
jgi:hypothetical protein